MSRNWPAGTVTPDMVRAVHDLTAAARSAYWVTVQLALPVGFAEEVVVVEVVFAVVVLVEVVFAVVVLIEVVFVELVLVELVFVLVDFLVVDVLLVVANAAASTVRNRSARFSAIAASFMMADCGCIETRERL